MIHSWRRARVCYGYDVVHCTRIRSDRHDLLSEEALVQYDAGAGAWVFSDAHGVQWCRAPAEQISAERILALDISARPSKNGGKPSCPD